MITIKRNQTANGAGSFTLIESNGKKFLCPAWIQVPMETRMEDIIVEEAPKTPRVEFGPNKEWTFIGSKGNAYRVERRDGRYTCTCPASMFQKFKDCKHIVEAKNEN